MPHTCEEQDVAEQHGEETHGVEEGGGVGDAEGPRRTEPEVEHRLGVVRRPVEEQAPSTTEPTKQADDPPVTNPRWAPRRWPRTRAASALLNRRTPG